MWRPVDFGKVCVLGWKVCVLATGSAPPMWMEGDGRCVSFNGGWTALGDVPRTGVWLI